MFIVKDLEKMRTSFNLIKACFDALEKQIQRRVNNNGNCTNTYQGRVGLNKDINETLDRLRLRRKYTCVVVNGSKKK